MQWRDLILEVRAARTDGGYNVGTGFPVSTTLVLTSRHVVRDAASNPPVVLVRWESFASPDDFQEVQPAKIDGFLASALLWEWEDLDLALVTTPALKNTSYISLCSQMPESGATYATRGFPAGAKVANQRSAISIFGVAHNVVAGENFFQFDVTNAPESIEGWGGLSGAPVVEQAKNGDGLAIGIVRRARSAFGSSRYLEVIPSSKLLSSASFAAKLAESSQPIIDAARASRIIAALASGKDTDHLRASSSHLNWYLREVDKLVELGLLERNTFRKTPLCDATISLINASGGFDYLY